MYAATYSRALIRITYLEMNYTTGSSNLDTDMNISTHIIPSPSCNTKKPLFYIRKSHSYERNAKHLTRRQRKLRYRSLLARPQSMLQVKENISVSEGDVITEEKRKKREEESGDVPEDHESEELWNLPVYTESFYGEEELSKLCEKSRRATTSTDHPREVDEPCMSIVDSSQTELHSLLPLSPRARKARLALGDQQPLKSRPATPMTSLTPTLPRLPKTSLQIRPVLIFLKLLRRPVAGLSANCPDWSDTRSVSD